MFLGIANAISGIKSGGLSFIKDNLKLYLDFKSNKSDTLKFPSEGSTEFNGTSDFIQIGALGDLGTDCTITAWVNRDTTSGSQYILDARGASNGGTGFAYFPTGSTTFIATTGTKYVDGVEGSTVEADGWHFIAIRGMTLNVNEDLKIGSRLNTNEFFNGKMANFAIWSRALEPEEIQSIMNKSYSQLKGVEKTSLVSWWALDSSTVSTNNLIPDSGFDDASAWNAEGDWSVNGTTSSKAVGAGAWEILRTNSGILTAGKKYRFTADVRRISGSSSGNFYFYANNTNSSAITPTTEVVTYTADLVSSGSGNYPKIRITGTAFTMEVDNFTVHEIDIHKDSHGSNDGSNFGATINSNVYGGNAPILPRAVDVAKEGQADAIGDGSANFDGDADHIELGSITSSNALSLSGSAGSISAWIYIPDVSDGDGFKRIVDKSDGVNGANGYAIYVNTDGTLATAIQSVNPITSDAGEITDAEWFHIAWTWNGSTHKLYKNGIEIKSASSSSVPPSNTANMSIGSWNHSTGREFKGNISQIGLWRGTLTQTQIQSVMESTSYSKIPADVKSTLGSELVQDSDWTEGTGWEDTGDNTWTYTSGTTSNLSAMNLSGLTVGNLYKIQYTITSNPDNVGLKWSGLNFFNANQGINSTVGTHTYYGVATTNDVEFRYQNGTGTIGLSNPSLKEVTNDIVAYYPLDGDSSRGNGTDDVTTGEVLGDELIENGIISTSQFALSPAYDSGTGVGATIDNGIVRIRTTGNAGVNINDDDLLESGALYKIVAVVSDATAGQLYFRGGNVYVTGQASTVGTHTIYLRTDGARLMISRNASDVDISISSLSVKKVLSNTGVLL